MAGFAGSSADMPISLLHRLMIAALILFINVSLAEEILLNVNIKKPLALTSDKFLSYTLDPTVVLTGNAFTKNPERSFNMAKALSPAYVRIGGPLSNSYTFVRAHQSRSEEDPGFTITEANWIDVNRWAENAGLEIVACIAPQHVEIEGRDPVWDSRNALDLISFSDQMGFNTSWQLGYECQTRCDVAGIDIGRSALRLRSMLDAFPRYSKSVVTGPDVVAYRTKQQQHYLQDYFNIAGNALSAITWHPNFPGISLDAEGVSMHHDNLAIDRDVLYRVVGRSISRKPLWLAESKPEECKKQFLGALLWTRRLGNAARLGVQVIMRQPTDSNLLQPTPDYWVSVLHKTLVGREVLDARITNGNRTHVHFYCQCTRPSSKYEKGSLTIFGINLTPDKILVNLRGSKIKTIHKYILLPGYDAENRMFSETVLLNNEPLNLVDDQELPEIKPAVSSNSKGVALKLPSGGIGFWVLPGFKIKSCGGVEEDSTDKMLLRKLSKRLEESETNEDGGEKEHKDNENLSTEERHYSSRSSKNRRRRKHRYSEEDDTERPQGGIEAKMDLERLEKLLRRRDSYDERKSSPRGRVAYFDLSKEETSQEIRNQLAGYKKRLREYESKIEKIESKSRDKIVETKMIDSDKVIEALELIPKMENAMEGSKLFDYEINAATLNPDDVNDVTLGGVASSKGKNSEETFLDELLKSKKIQRTPVPTRIEEQLRGIYQMLIDEKERRRRESPEAKKTSNKQDAVETSETAELDLSRSRRDADKKFGVDPLGLRKEGLFRRLGRINEEARERRIDRRNRRKDNREDRKDEESSILGTKTTDDSEENNFYGFHKREPVKNFPQGDIYLAIEDSKEENSNDYDYVKDDDDDEVRDAGKTTESLKKNETVRIKPEHDDDTWIEDANIQTDHVPIEFFENVKMAANLPVSLKKYGELWEAESHADKTDDSPSTRVDDVSTVEKIVPEENHDIHEDIRAKELTIEKLIDYYADPTAHRDEIVEYEDHESVESNERSDLRTLEKTSLTIGDVENSRIGQFIYRKNPLVARKLVKDLTSGEDGRSMDFDSIHFGRSSVPSTEEPALVNHDVRYQLAGSTEKRTKRSTDHLLEDVLDREMIFQDYNNLRDCDCRVPRTIRLRENPKSTKQRSRVRRPEKSDLRERILRVGKRGRNEKREERSNSKSDPRPDEDYTRSTRPRRDVESSNEETLESMTKEPKFIQDDTSESEPSTTEKSKDLSSDNYSGYEESEDSNSDNLTTENSVDLSSVEQDKENDEGAKNLALEEEMISVTVESESTGITQHVVKRRYEETTTSQNNRMLAEATEVTESLATSAKNVETSTLGDYTKPEVVSLGASKAPRVKFFRDRQSKKESAKRLSEAKEIEETNPSDRQPLASLAKAQISSPEIDTRIVETRSIDTIARKDTSSTAIPDVITEGTIEKVEQVKGDDTKDPTSSDQSEIALTSKTWTMTEASTTQVPSSIPGDEKIVLSKSIENDTVTTEDTSQRTKKASKTIAPVKLRGARLAACSTTPILSPRRNNVEGKVKKLRRIEKFEKLREKLRPKRGKLVDDYLDDFLNNLEEMDNDDEEIENRFTREMTDMMLNDEELRDLVDPEKFDYLVRNKPINYEAMVNESDDDDAREMRNKYVPKTIEIVKPPHVTRERRVKPRNQRVRATKNPKLMAPAVPEERSNSEAMRDLKDDPTDHKIERRDDESYYSVAESLENPRIYRHQQSWRDEESGQEISTEMEDASESNQTLTDSSSAKNNHEFAHNHDENGGIEESNEKTVQSPKVSEDLMKSLRNAATNNCMCPKKKSKEISIEESSDEMFKLVKQKDHYTAVPIDGARNDDKYEHVSKKRNLKNSDYVLVQKYDSPKYAGLPVDRSEFVDDERVSRTRFEDQLSSEVLNNRDTLEDTGSRSMMKKSVGGSNVENKSWIVKRMREYPRQRNLAMIDDVDLDEALYSSKYEILMLIPVYKSEKRVRRKRHVDNKIPRDQGEPVANDITIEMMPKTKEARMMTKDTRKDTMLDDDTTITKMNDIDWDQATLASISRDNDDDSNTIVKDSTIMITGEPKKLHKKDETILNRSTIEETVRSVQKNVPNDLEKSLDDEGLPDLLEEAIPKLEATVTGGLGKARRISESFEKFMDDFDDRFNQKQLELEIEGKQLETDVENNAPISSDVFGGTLTSVRNFFDFLSGLIHVFRFN